MAVLAEVIGHNYTTRDNLTGQARKLSLGEQIVVKGIPEFLKGKLKAVKDVPDSELIVNDNPTAARLREEGKSEAADKEMATTDAAEQEELNELRAQYEALIGEKPHHKMKADGLRKKMNEFTQGE